MSPNVSPRGTEDRANNLRGSERTAFESAALLRFPHWLKFETPSPDPKPDPKPDPIEERFAALEKRAADAEAKANAAHAELRRLKKSEKPVEDTEDDSVDPADKKPKAKPSAADKELAARVAELEEDRKLVAEDAKNTALDKALTSIGLAGEDLDDARDIFIHRHGKDLTYDRKSRKVLIKLNEIDDPIPIGDHIAAEAKAGKFKRYKPAPETNKTGPTNGARARSGGEGLPKFKRVQDVPADMLKSGAWELDTGT